MRQQWDMEGKGTIVILYEAFSWLFTFNRNTFLQATGQQNLVEKS